MAKGDVLAVRSERAIDATTTEFKNNLKREGWKLLGFGLYSEAYGKGNRVWKISKHNKTDATIFYLRAILNGEIKSPHAPQIFRILTCQGGGYAVLMERLKEAKTRKALTRKYPYGFESVIHSPSKNMNKPFLNFIKSVVEKFPSLNTDLHLGNAMIRYRTTMVLTDPFCGIID